MTIHPHLRAASQALYEAYASKGKGGKIYLTFAKSAPLLDANFSDAVGLAAIRLELLSEESVHDYIITKQRTLRELLQDDDGLQGNFIPCDNPWVYDTEHATLPKASAYLASQHSLGNHGRYIVVIGNAGFERFFVWTPKQLQRWSETEKLDDETRLKIVHA